MDIPQAEMMSTIDEVVRRRLDKHVDDVVQCLIWRDPQKSKSHLVPRLSNLVAGATDCGLAGAVFWHGRWFSYSDAKYMLNRLESD